MATQFRIRAFLLCAVFVVQQVHAGTRPPAIHTQPDKDVYFKAGETVFLPCIADGNPTPTYEWTRNGLTFVPSGNDDRIDQLVNEGTIVFSRAEDKDEGVYQCFATNAFGTSVSVRVNLREAKLRDFDIGADATVSALVGHSATLNCVPPQSVPPADVFWVVKEPNGGFVPVNYEARKLMDPESRLRITNVKSEDRAGGKPYACMAINRILRKSTQGRQFFIEPLGTHEEVNPTSYMWASPEDHFGLRGDNFTLTCIFAGYPTPEIHWERTDGAAMPDGAQIENFGHDLVFYDLQFEDAGTYECSGTNSQTVTPVRRTFTVRVESRPSWQSEPQDVEVAPGGTAEFRCQAEGQPRPQLFWHINGLPLNQAAEAGSILTSGRFDHSQSDRLVFSNLTLADSMVIQCNATNKHGYIWSDFFLNVLPEGSQSGPDAVVG